jgi:hypothetical protein
MAMRENGSRDYFVLARVALEAAIPERGRHHRAATADVCFPCWNGLKFRRDVCRLRAKNSGSKSCSQP